MGFFCSIGGRTVVIHGTEWVGARELLLMVCRSVRGKRCSSASTQRCLKRAPSSKLARTWFNWLVKGLLLLQSVTYSACHSPAVWSLWTVWSHCGLLSCNLPEQLPLHVCTCPKLCVSARPEGVLSQTQGSRQWQGVKAVVVSHSTSPSSPSNSSSLWIGISKFWINLFPSRKWLGRALKFVDGFMWTSRGSTSGESSWRALNQKPLTWL